MEACAWALSTVRTFVSMKSTFCSFMPPQQDIEIYVSLFSFFFFLLHTSLGKFQNKSSPWWIFHQVDAGLHKKFKRNKERRKCCYEPFDRAIDVIIQISSSFFLALFLRLPWSLKRQDGWPKDWCVGILFHAQQLLGSRCFAFISVAPREYKLIFPASPPNVRLCEKESHFH